MNALAGRNAAGRVGKASSRPETPLICMQVTPLFEPLRQRIPKRWRLAALSVVLAVSAFQLVSAIVEEGVRSRLRRFAARASATLRVERLHVGIWPPLTIAGLTFDRPGQWTLRVDELKVRPQFWNRSRPGLAARTSIGSVHLTLPAELEATLLPSSWDIDRSLSGDLREPVEGLAWSVIKTGQGRRVEIEASHLDLDRLITGGIEGHPTARLGLLDGGAHWTETANRGFDALWRFVALGSG